MDNPKIRVTGILIENGKILLVEQKVTESQSRDWSLPGGGLEFGESIENCLIREILEETGLEVTVKELLYICDRIQDGRHIVHLTFSVERLGGKLTKGYEPEKDTNPIKDVQMIAVEQLTNYGFSMKFQDLASASFPGKGTYKGSVANIGL